MSARLARSLTLGIAGALAIFAGPRASAQNITANTAAPTRGISITFRADLNRDGKIDAVDVRLFLETRTAGAKGTLITDINADGSLDQMDLATLLELISVGATPQATQESASTPATPTGSIAPSGLMRMVTGA